MFYFDVIRSFIPPSRTLRPDVNLTFELSLILTCTRNSGLSDLFLSYSGYRHAYDASPRSRQLVTRDNLLLSKFPAQSYVAVYGRRFPNPRGGVSSRDRCHLAHWSADFRCCMPSIGRLQIDGYSMDICLLPDHMCEFVQSTSERRSRRRLHMWSVSRKPLLLERMWLLMGPSRDYMAACCTSLRARGSG